jgi:hypothetical protein
MVIGLRLKELSLTGGRLATSSSRPKYRVIGLGFVPLTGVLPSLLASVGGQSHLTIDGKEAWSFPVGQSYVTENGMEWALLPMLDYVLRHKKLPQGLKVVKKATQSHMA